MQYRRRRRIERQAPSSNTGQMMNLSLFIMLLAFFIVLNAISSYEDEKKLVEVRESIQMTFSADVQQEDFSPSLTPDEAKSVNDGDTFERVEALFQAQVIAFEASKSKSKGMMAVKVPYEDFSKAMAALDQYDLTKNPTRLESHQNFFLPTLVSLMKTDIDGAPTRLEIYLNVDENPPRIQNQKPQALKAVINDAGRFSRLLRDKGMPQKLLNIGVSKGDPEFVQLVFRKYKPFSPIQPSTETGGSNG